MNLLNDIIVKMIKLKQCFKLILVNGLAWSAVFPAVSIYNNNSYHN